MKLVYGIGVNDANYVVYPVINGRQVMCHAYAAWKSMLTRCYSKKFHAKCPTYVGVTVCDEWLSFMSFRSWWVDHHVDGWSLDKDLLSDGRVYSPDSCIYIPQWLNCFTIDGGAARGDCPIGVSYCKREGKYRAHCSHPLSGQEFLGYFRSKDGAYLAWLSRKRLIAAEFKPAMDAIDARIYHRVVEIINNSK